MLFAPKEKQQFELDLASETLAKSIANNTGAARHGAFGEIFSLFTTNYELAARTLSRVMQSTLTVDHLGDSNSPRHDHLDDFVNRLSVTLAELKPQELSELAPILFDPQTHTPAQELPTKQWHSCQYRTDLKLKQDSFVKASLIQARAGNHQALDTIKDQLSKEGFAFDRNYQVRIPLEGIASLSSIQGEARARAIVRLTFNHKNISYPLISNLHELALSDQDKIAVYQYLAKRPKEWSSQDSESISTTIATSALSVFHSLESEETRLAFGTEILAQAQRSITRCYTLAPQLRHAETLNRYTGFIATVSNDFPHALSRCNNQNTKARLTRQFAEFQNTNLPFLILVGQRTYSTTNFAPLLSNLPIAEQRAQLYRFDQQLQFPISKYNRQQLSTLFALAKIRNQDTSSPVNVSSFEAFLHNLELLKNKTLINTLTLSLAHLGRSHFKLTKEEIIHWLNYEQLGLHVANIHPSDLEALHNNAALLVPSAIDLSNRDKAVLLGSTVVNNLDYQGDSRNRPTNLSCDHLFRAASNLDEESKQHFLTLVRSQLPRLSGSEGLAAFISSLENDQQKLVLLQDYLEIYRNNHTDSISGGASNLSHDQINVILSSFTTHSSYLEAMQLVGKLLSKSMHVSPKDIFDRYHTVPALQHIILHGFTESPQNILGTHYTAAIDLGMLNSIATRKFSSKRELDSALRLYSDLHTKWYGSAEPAQVARGLYIGGYHESNFPLGATIYFHHQWDYPETVFRALGAISAKSHYLEFN